MRIKETKEVYEGEVTELTPVETESPTAAAGSGSASGGGPVYGKTISHLIIGTHIISYLGQAIWDANWD